MHPRSKHWHLIDYVIVRRKDRQDVRVTKTICGADCWTDHRLVVLVWICRFPLPLGVWEGLRFVIVALPGLFSYFFYCQQTQPAHSACTTTSRQEGVKEIRCLQAETRQQEASIRQRSLQPFRCTGTQLRRCR